MFDHSTETRTSHLVIGAGVIGVSIATELARKGQEVVIVDRGDAGAGTTSSSYAWVNANSKDPKSYAELNLLGLRAHERWSAESPWPWFHQVGNLQLLTPRDQLASAEEKVTRYRDVGYPAYLLSAAEVADREPGLQQEANFGAIHFPLEGWADTSVMIAVLLQSALRYGAEYRPYHEVIELTGNGAVVVGPDSTYQRIIADVTVLAAGNGSRELAESHGLNAPVLPMGIDDPVKATNPGSTTTIGMTCTTGPVSQRPNSLIHSHEVSFRPASNGGVVLTDHPTASGWGTGGDDLWSGPGKMLQKARRLLPALERVDIASVQLGYRVLPEDGLTIADWLDKDARYFLAATHSGITLAPHLGEVITQEIMGGVRSPSLYDFGLDRFQRSQVFSN